MAGERRKRREEVGEGGEGRGGGEGHEEVGKSSGKGGEL